MPSKRPHRKSRLGCIQCKQRRIRCCGGPPQCDNCCKHSLECEYKQWTFATSVPVHVPLGHQDWRQSSHVLTSASRQIELSKDCFKDEEEDKKYPLQLIHPSPSPLFSLSSLSAGWNPGHAATLHYFRTFAGADFKGYLASEFWTSMLYQKSEDCAPVHQALLAISNAHRERVTAFAEPLSGSTLKLYVKAIQMAVDHMQDSTIDEVRATSLYCCAIFYCFELFNKNPQAADIHLDNGLRLLREWHRVSPTWPPLRPHEAARDDFAKLLYTIGRLDLDRMLRNVSIMGSEHDEKIFTSGLSPQSEHPADYFDLKCKMMLLSRRITRFVRHYDHPDTMPISDVPAHVLFRRLQLQSQITEMEAMLDRRETNLRETSSSERHERTALATLRLYLVSHRLRLTMMFATDQAQRAAVYDDYADTMLYYAKMAWSTFSAQSERAPLLPEPGVLVPMQWLAKGVSRADSRREALEFIDGYYAIEGVSVFE